MRRLLAILSSLALVILPPASSRGAVPASCAGPSDANPTTSVTFTGSFGKDLMGSYVLVPFDVPSGVTRVRVKICYDQPDIPISTPVVSVRNTLDLGVYDALQDGFYDANEFRGWGGSSRPNVLITPEAAPSKDNFTDGTTVGYKPGPIPAGRWAAEIGVAAVNGLTEGDLDQKVYWRLEITTAYLASDLDNPWTPTAYDSTPAKAGPEWFKGDMHVHAEHSNPNDADMSEAFDYAFNQAGLDFFTLSDYVTNRHWDEIGRFQSQYAGHLIIRSSEVITYRGHINNHASLRFVDYRTGPMYERRPSGRLVQVRATRPASAIFNDIHLGAGPDGRGGWTQVNHPTIFPSQVPTFAQFCRGCSWAYSDDETRWDKVDAFEIATGPQGLDQPEGNEPGPNPFTVLAIAWYDHIRAMGYDVTAVGSSDSHKAGRTTSPLQAPIGEATTVVYARELSEAGIRDGVLAGHAYVKFFSPSGPDLRFTAGRTRTSQPYIMGDQLKAASAFFTARVTGAAPSPQIRMLLVMRNGFPYLAFPVLRNDQTFRFRAVLPGDYRLQLMRGTAFEAFTNPITLKAP